MGGENIPKGHSDKERKAARPADIVFKDKLERTYQSALNLIGKVQSLSRHRALKHDGGEELAAMLNRFIERVDQEMDKCVIKPGSPDLEVEEPTLGEFLSG